MNRFCINSRYISSSVGIILAMLPIAYSCQSHRCLYDHSVSINDYDFESTDSIPKKIGATFIRFLIPPQYETINVTVIEYTGRNFNSPFVQKREVVIKEALKHWVKTWINSDCITSINLEERIGWTWIEDPAEKINLYEVLDTTKISNFKRRIIPIKRLISEGGISEWREVLCQNFNKLIENVHKALKTSGFIIDQQEIVNKSIGPSTKAAIYQFQRENNLPEGQLDLATLKKLKINY